MPPTLFVSNCMTSTAFFSNNCLNPNKVYDRRPGLLPTTFGIKLAKDLAKQLGKFN